MFALRFVGLISVSLTIAGCGSVPSFDNLNGRPITASPKVADLVTHIQCEIWRIKQTGEFPKLSTQKYVAFAQLTVDVTNLEGTAPSLNFIHPYLAPMTNLTYGIGGQLTGTQHRNMTQSFSINLNDPQRDAEATCADQHKNKVGSQLAGDLGLEAIIRDGMDRSQDDDFVFHQPIATTAGLNQTNLPVFGSTVDFTIVYGLSNVGPTWTLTHFKGPGGGSGGGGGGGAAGASGGASGGGGSGGAQGLLTLTRTNKDTLIISFAPVCPTPSTCPIPKPAFEPTPTPKLEEIIVPRTKPNFLEQFPPKNPAERSSLLAAQSLQDTTTSLAAAVKNLQSLYLTQIQATDALRQTAQVQPSDATAAAVRAAQDNNTRMLLQNLLNP